MSGQTVPYKVPTNLNDALQIVQGIIDQNTPGDQRKTLVSMVYGDMNSLQGKGITRKLRKALRSLGFSYHSALPAC